MEERELEILQRFDESRNAYNKATALQKQGKTDDAEALLRQALTLYPREFFMDDELEVDPAIRASFDTLFSSIKARLEDITRTQKQPGLGTGAISNLQELIERNLRLREDTSQAPPPRPGARRPLTDWSAGQREFEQDAPPQQEPEPEPDTEDTVPAEQILDEIARVEDVDLDQDLFETADQEQDIDLAPVEVETEAEPEIMEAPAAAQAEPEPKLMDLPEEPAPAIEEPVAQAPEFELDEETAPEPEALEPEPRPAPPDGLDIFVDEPMPATPAAEVSEAAEIEETIQEVAEIEPGPVEQITEPDELPPLAGEPEIPDMADPDVDVLVSTAEQPADDPLGEEVVLDEIIPDADLEISLDADALSEEAAPTIDDTSETEIEIEIDTPGDEIIAQETPAAQAPAQGDTLDEAGVDADLDMDIEADIAEPEPAPAHETQFELPEPVAATAEQAGEALDEVAVDGDADISLDGEAPAGPSGDFPEPPPEPQEPEEEPVVGEDDPNRDEFEDLTPIKKTETPVPADVTPTPVSAPPPEPAPAPAKAEDVSDIPSAISEEQQAFDSMESSWPEHADDTLDPGDDAAPPEEQRRGFFMGLKDALSRIFKKKKPAEEDDLLTLLEEDAAETPAEAPEEAAVEPTEAAPAPPDEAAPAPAEAATQPAAETEQAPAPAAEAEAPAQAPAPAPEAAPAAEAPAETPAAQEEDLHPDEEGLEDESVVAEMVKIEEPKPRKVHMQVYDSRRTVSLVINVFILGIFGAGLLAAYIIMKPSVRLHRSFNYALNTEEAASETGPLTPVINAAWNTTVSEKKKAAHHVESLAAMSVVLQDHPGGKALLASVAASEMATLTGQNKPADALKVFNWADSSGLNTQLLSTVRYRSGLTAMEQEIKNNKYGAAKQHYEELLKWLQEPDFPTPGMNEACTIEVRIAGFKMKSRTVQILLKKGRARDAFFEVVDLSPLPGSMNEKSKLAIAQLHDSVRQGLQDKAKAARENGDNGTAEDLVNKANQLQSPDLVPAN